MAGSEQLLSEFIDAWNAGRRPRVEDYVDQAPDAERDELAGLINAFLQDAPAPAYSPETLEQIRGEPAVQELARLYESESGLWPSLLPRLRRRARLTRDEVVAGLARGLLLEGREDRIKRYYHRMEAGTIDPAGVSRKVLKALSGVFGVSLAEIEQAGDFGLPELAAADGLYLRAAVEEDHGMADLARMERLQAAGPATPGPRADMDEVDRLFLGGR